MAKPTPPTSTTPRGVRIRRGKIYIEYPNPQNPSKRKERPLDYACTPANITFAGQIRQQIIEQLEAGCFDEAEFFGTPKEKTPRRKPQQLFNCHAQRWLDLPTHDWSINTRKKYKDILTNHWMPYLHEGTR